MPSTTRKYRPTLPICPAWCEGHDELFQPWEQSIRDLLPERQHNGLFAEVGDAELALGQVESMGGMQEAYVQLYLNREGRLTRTEARQLAAALLAAAETLGDVL